MFYQIQGTQVGTGERATHVLDVAFQDAKLEYAILLRCMPYGVLTSEEAVNATDRAEMTEDLVLVRDLCEGVGGQLRNGSTSRILIIDGLRVSILRHPFETVLSYHKGDTMCSCVSIYHFSMCRTLQASGRVGKDDESRSGDVADSAVALDYLAKVYVLHLIFDGSAVAAAVQGHFLARFRRGLTGHASESGMEVAGIDLSCEYTDTRAEASSRVSERHLGSGQLSQTLTRLQLQVPALLSIKPSGPAGLCALDATL